MSSGHIQKILLVRKRTFTAGKFHYAILSPASLFLVVFHLTCKKPQIDYQLKSLTFIMIISELVKHVMRVNILRNEGLFGQFHKERKRRHSGRRRNQTENRRPQREKEKSCSVHSQGWCKACLHTPTSHHQSTFQNNLQPPLSIF